MKNLHHVRGVHGGARRPSQGRTHKYLYTAAAILLGGCSDIPIPWGDNFLDPGRIATREPLEIPPDLDHLPPAAGKETSPQTDKQDPSVLLPFQIPPERQDDASLSRTKKERLPDWMGSESLKR